VYSICKICGNRWSWETDNPPTVNVRPDLIAMGEQRLREQEAQDAANQEAAYHAFIEPDIQKYWIDPPQ